ncbi:MAG: hypothetical protein ACP5H1_08480 [Acidilobus sp.]
MVAVDGQVTARTAVISARVSPEAKYTLLRYASEHNIHVYTIIERVARCLNDNPKASLEECLSTK